MLMGLRNLALVIIVQFTNTFFDEQCHFFFETKDLASASGPIKVQLAAKNQPHATFEVSVRPLSNVPGTDAKSLPYTMRSLLSSLSKPTDVSLARRIITHSVIHYYVSAFARRGHDQCRFTCAVERLEYPGARGYLRCFCWPCVVQL